MKTVTVTAGSRENPITATAQINNAAETDELTPALARRASRIAFGHTSSAVTDGRKTYRLSGSTARLILHETAGRPRFDPDAPTVRTTVRLTQAQVAKAEALGNGNVAQGVRQAIEQAGEPAKEDMMDDILETLAAERIQNAELVAELIRQNAWLVAENKMISDQRDEARDELAVSRRK